MQAASLNLGGMMHARHAPRENRFAYAMFTLCLPLSGLADAASPLLGVNRPGLLAFHERDHGARDGSPLLPWMRALLHQHGVDEADGEIVLQTMPRLFGFVFNPVSFWYCHDREGALRAVLCEVNNTFGEHHNYLVAHADRRPIAPQDVLRARKVFHVSPFLPVRGEYRFRFSRRGGYRAVSIDCWDAGMLVLSTRLSGRDLPLGSASIVKALLRCPLLTFGVVARINWQALRLLARRIPWLRKPLPPVEETT